MSNVLDTVARNLEMTHGCVASACVRAGRREDSVRLLAVTKYARPEWIEALFQCGVCDLGESRPQQLLERTVQFGDSIRWHLVGHLQRNKARKMVPAAWMIHAVDTLRLLETVERLGAELGRRPRVLLEVNVSGEASKNGFSPEDLRTNWDTVAACRHVDVAGLMTMAPLTSDKDGVRRVFRGLRELRDELVKSAGGRLRLKELSMGMSGDFEIAVEEGATIIRIGSALYDGL